MSCKIPSTELRALAHRAATAERKIEQALFMISAYGGIDGAHHKSWTLDQVVRTLAGESYAAWVAEQKAGEDGPDTYAWDEGIAP